MTKYKLTNEEKEIITKYQKQSIPYIFRSGQYSEYMQYFEYIDFDICYCLLKGKRIDTNMYKMIMQGDDIDVKKLDNNALQFYNTYIKVTEIAKKYYNQVNEIHVKIGK